jgi:hypothetical protein
MCVALFQRRTTAARDCCLLCKTIIWAKTLQGSVEFDPIPQIVACRSTPPTPNGQSDQGYAEDAPRKPLCVFLISNTGRDPVASNWRIVYLFDGVHRNDVGLFAGTI